MKRIYTYLSICALTLALALPVITSENTGDGGAQAIKAELTAMAERGEQTKCPISGAAVKEGQGFVFHGHMLATCCGDCAKKVESDPLAALLKIRKNGEEPKLAEGFAKVTTCPMSGKALVAETATVKNYAMVSFCCPNCKAAYEKDPASVLGKMDEKKIAPTLITLEQTACPISGHAVVETSTIVHQGKNVKLCCEACKASFEAEPAKFMSAMADQGIVLENAG